MWPDQQLITMKHFNILLILFCFGFVSCGRQVVKVAYDPDIEDYTPVVREILENHPGGNLEIVFGQGTYPFYPELAASKYLAVSNNDNGDKRVVFLIEGMRNVIIRGAGATEMDYNTHNQGQDGTEFLLHGSLVPFAVYASSDIRIEGVSIDYDYPWTFEGEVIANDAAARSITLKVLPEDKYSIRDGELFFGGYDWEYPLAENIVFDRQTRDPYYNTALYDHASWEKLTAIEIEKGIVELRGLTSRSFPPVGSIWDNKGPHAKNRHYPGIFICRSENVVVEDVHIFRSGAMALIAEYSKDITLRNYSTAVRRSSSRMVGVSADATHFVDCGGTVTLENCLFESMLDDASNVHGTYMKVDKATASADGRVLLKTSFGHCQQEGNVFAEKGAELCFIDRASLRRLGDGVVTDIRRTVENSYEIEVDSDCPDMLLDENRSIVAGNISMGASAVIRNCIVRHNRARSLLISTPGDVLIEGCDFASMMAGIRICGDANFWFESGPTDNVVIKGNRFRNLGIGGHSPQAILQIDPVIPVENRGNDAYYHKNVVFEDNTIETFDSQVIYALSVGNMTIKGNRFVDSGTFKPLFGGLPVVDLLYCGNVTVEGNDFSEWKPDAVISLHNCMDVSDLSGLEAVDEPNPYFYKN